MKTQSTRRIFLPLLMLLFACVLLAGGLITAIDWRGKSLQSADLPQISNVSPVADTLATNAYIMLDLNGQPVEEGVADTFENFSNTTDRDHYFSREIHASFFVAKIVGATEASSSDKFVDADGNDLSFTQGSSYRPLLTSSFFTITHMSNAFSMKFTAISQRDDFQLVPIYVKAVRSSIVYPVNLYVRVVSSFYSLFRIKETGFTDELLLSIPSDVVAPFSISDGSEKSFILEDQLKPSIQTPVVLTENNKSFFLRNISNLNIISVNPSAFENALKLVRIGSSISFIQNVSGNNTGFNLRAALDDSNYESVLRANGTDNPLKTLSMVLSANIPNIRPGSAGEIENTQVSLNLSVTAIITESARPVVDHQSLNLVVDFGSVNASRTISAWDFATFYRRNTAKNDSMWLNQNIAGSLQRVQMTYNGADKSFTITPINLGSQVVTLSVMYVLPSGTQTLEVSLTITVLGTKTFNTLLIQGRRVARIFSDGTYTLPGKRPSDNLFSDLLAEGFTLDNVNAYTAGATTKTSKYITVDFQNGVATITPKLSTDVDVAKVELTFVNLDGITRVYLLDFIIDMETPTFFGSPLEPYQIILIWVAIGIGIVIIIAIIVAIAYISVAKKKKSMLQQAAPTSAYLLKLNSTIAQAQVQRTLQAHTSMMQQPTTLQLAAPPPPGGAPVNTLQLGYNPNASQTPPPAYAPPYGQQNQFMAGSTGATYAPPTPPTFFGASPAGSGPNTIPLTPPPAESVFAFGPPASPAPGEANNEIIIPISDEELIERVFVEKYEPKGMTRRSYFKNETLKRRELEKEKERIKELIRSGVAPAEAVKSTVQAQAAPAAGNAQETPVNAQSQESAPTEPATSGVVTGEKIDEDYSRYMGLYIKYVDTSKVSFDEFYNNPKLKSEIMLKGLMGAPSIEEERSKIVLPDTDDRRSQSAKELDEQTFKLENLEENIVEVQTRYEKFVADLGRVNNDVVKMQSEIDRLNIELPKMDDEITELNVKMSTARSKDKDKIAAQINAKENEIKDAKALIAKNSAAIAAKKNDAAILEENSSKIKADVDMANDMIEKLRADKQRLEEVVAKEEADRLHAIELAERDRKKTELKILLAAPNNYEKTIAQLASDIERNSKKRDELKAEIAAMQAQMLTATDMNLISSLSAKIGESNSIITSLEKENSAKTKKRSDSQIELTAARRKATEYIENNKMPLEDIVDAEDEVLADLTYDKYIDEVTNEQMAAELALLEAEAEVAMSGGANIAEIAMKVAEKVSKAEAVATEASHKTDEIKSEKESVQAELNKINEEMLSADLDVQLELTMRQMDLDAKFNELSEAFTQAAADAQKAREEAERVKAEGIKSNLESKMKMEQTSEFAAKALEEARARYEAASEQLNRALSMTNKKDLIASGSGVISSECKIKEAENLKRQLEESNRAVEQARLAADRARLEAEQKILEAQRASESARAEAERRADEARRAAEQAAMEAERAAEQARVDAENRLRLQSEEIAEKYKTEAELAKTEAERAREEAERAAAEARQQADKEVERLRLEFEAKQKQEAEEQRQMAEKQNERIRLLSNQLDLMQSDISLLKDEESSRVFQDKLLKFEANLEPADKVPAVMNMLERLRSDARHQTELSLYKDLANRPTPAASAPIERNKVVRKVERVNMIPRPKPESRPAGASGARPAGARPAGASGARPAGASGARPVGASGARPAGTRPAGAPGARPAGARPAGAPGARPAGARPAGAPPPRRPQQ